MQYSPSSEANSSAPRHDIPNYYYRIHSSQSPIPQRVRWIQPTFIRPVRLRSILISSHLRLDLPVCLFPSSFPTKTLREFLLSPDTCYMSPPSHRLLCGHPNDVWWAAQIMKLLSTKLFRSLATSVHSPYLACVLPLMWQKVSQPNHTAQNYSSAYINLHFLPSQN